MRAAIIPARGGSKRIPRKNIKPFCGQPMIAWSIAAAQKSGLFDRIIVSTDDDEVAAIARKHGAEVPFMRPPHLSDDHCGTVPVIAHAAEWLKAAGESVDELACIYATAPMIEADDLQRGLEAITSSGADYAFSVTSYAFPIQRAVKLAPSGRVAMFDPAQQETRSQDLEEAYHDAGQFYWGTAEAWTQEKPIMSEGSAAVVLPRHRVQDIDTPEDWVRAEAMMKSLRGLG
jgi:N-acylneuraminate cytidylyltransferase